MVRVVRVRRHVTLLRFGVWMIGCFQCRQYIWVVARLFRRYLWSVYRPLFKSFSFVTCAWGWARLQVFDVYGFLVVVCVCGKRLVFHRDSDWILVVWKTTAPVAGKITVFASIAILVLTCVWAMYVSIVSISIEMILSVWIVTIGFVTVTKFLQLGGIKYSTWKTLCIFQILIREWSC